MVSGICHSPVGMIASSVTAPAPNIEWVWRNAVYVPVWHEAILEQLRRHVQPGACVLEIGAGGSPALPMLNAELECSVFGVELDWAGIASTMRFAVERQAKTTMLQANAFILPLRDGLFDVVYSLGVIEHFPHEQTRALLAEHVRVCRPGGLVLVSVPNLLNLPHTVHKLLAGKRYRYYPERSYLLSRFASLMREVGLEVVAVDGILPLWGLGRMRGGWRFRALVSRFPALRGLASRTARTRALTGYMTYVIARRPIPLTALP